MSADIGIQHSFPSYGLFAVLTDAEQEVGWERLKKGIEDRWEEAHLQHMLYSGKRTCGGGLQQEN
jgi:hypothetical protein